MTLGVRVRERTPYSYLLARNRPKCGATHQTAYKKSPHGVCRAAIFSLLQTKKPH
jgi:hypothetical protein